jgi:hypothetical protein
LTDRKLSEYNILKQGRWIAYPADRINVPRALAAPALLFVPFFVAVSNGQLAAYGIILFLLIGKSNYLLHPHIHRPFAASGHSMSRSILHSAWSLPRSIRIGDSSISTAEALTCHIAAIGLGS